MRRSGVPCFFFDCYDFLEKKGSEKSVENYFKFPQNGHILC